MWELWVNTGELGRIESQRKVNRQTSQQRPIGIALRSFHLPNSWHFYLHKQSVAHVCFIMGCVLEITLIPRVLLLLGQLPERKGVWGHCYPGWVRVWAFIMISPSMMQKSIFLPTCCLKDWKRNIFFRFQIHLLYILECPFSGLTIYKYGINSYALPSVLRALSIQDIVKLPIALNFAEKRRLFKEQAVMDDWRPLPLDQLLSICRNMLSLLSVSMSRLSFLDHFERSDEIWICMEKLSGSPSSVMLSPSPHKWSA